MMLVLVLSKNAEIWRCVGCRPFGPISSHCWSNLVACLPSNRFSLGIIRWIIGGKNPSILEKLCINSEGEVLICLVVAVARASAIIRPMIVTSNAANLREGGIVMVGVFDGRKFKVRIRPAMMLPQARRSMGAVSVWWFSLIGDRVVNRGEPIVTKKMTRRL